MKTPRTLSMGRVRPAAAGLAMILLSAFAVVTIVAIAPSAGAIYPHNPPGPWVRLVLALMWAGLQGMGLVAAFIARPLAFGAACFVMIAGGFVVMALGRAGFDLAMLGAAFSAAVPVAILSLATAIWLEIRNPLNTPAARSWRVFWWLCLVGAVYLFASHPAESGSHLLAVAVSIGLCGASAMFTPRLMWLVRLVDQVPIARLSLLAWALCALLLVVNGVWMRATGAGTPQMQLVGLSIAPYFVAAGLMLFGVALDAGGLAARGWRAFIPSAIGLPVTAVLYVVLLDESGTLAVVSLSVLTIALLVGTPTQAFAAALTVVGAMPLLQSKWIIATVGVVAPRPAARLMAWSARGAVPNQIARVMEATTSAGVLGHAGAARMRFLIGPQVAKDYMPALILANGGWVGMALVAAGSFLFVAELYRAMRSTEGTAGRAMQTAVLALLVGNLLATTLWIGGLTPFVGVPLPILARAGSHLVALAALLVVFDLAAAVNHRPR